jgi:Fe-S cluster assembly protein SufD
MLVMDPKDLLHTLRKRSWDRFQEIGMPKRKQEAFQYVTMERLSLPPLAPKTSLFPQKNRIVFSNGYFQGGEFPSPLVCIPLDAAMRSYGMFLQNRIVRSLKEEKDPFAALNGACLGSGAFLYIPPGAQIEEPLEIDFLASSTEMSSPRLQIYMGKGSSLKLILRTSSETKDSFSNSLVDAALDEGASLEIYESQKSLGTSFHSCRATLKRDSRFRSLSFSQGSVLSRTSIQVQLLEENSEALIEGLIRMKSDVQNHIHALVEHAAPHTRSRQRFKCMLEDTSRSSFEGKILVRPIAQKTEAYQINNNLLLSPGAVAFSKPNLEIFADDVKASHGSTIGQLDMEELFYLQSRGLPLLEAQKWLSSGFCQELINAAPALFRKEL